MNQWRRVRSMSPLSYGALQRFVKASPVMVLEKRCLKTTEQKHQRGHEIRPRGTKLALKRP